MSDWRTLEIYATFMRVAGELEIVQPDRVSDVVNRFGDHLQLRQAVTEPLSLAYPVLSRRQTAVTVAKAAVSIICPFDDAADGNPALWREKVPQPVMICTQALSLMGDVHLEPRRTFADQLERSSGDFVPLTNVSGVWVTGTATVTHTLQRPFALLNPAAIVSWSLQDSW